MDELRRLIIDNEDWLMQQILHYAKAQDYVRYTSTLAEAWRISIENLSRTILSAIDDHDDGDTKNSSLELRPDDNYALDPIASFGIVEARKHRARGLTLGMFLSLLKYYRRCYIDLIRGQDFDRGAEEAYRSVVDHCFDRIELGLCTEWSEATHTEHLDELQASNRFLANDKTNISPSSKASTIQFSCSTATIGSPT